MLFQNLRRIRPQDHYKATFNFFYWINSNSTTQLFLDANVQKMGLPFIEHFRQPLAV
jgi:hypothetical protein